MWIIRPVNGLELVMFSIISHFDSQLTTMFMAFFLNHTLIECTSLIECLSDYGDESWKDLEKNGFSTQAKSTIMLFSGALPKPFPVYRGHDA